HTRNKFYLENVATLFGLIQKAGYKVRIGTLIPEIHEPTELTLEISGRKLLLEPIQRSGDRIHVGDYTPCAILLNNDLSAGVPSILENIEQQVIPPTYAGWSMRRKSRHFSAYRRVAEEFARLIDIDPWLIDPYYDTCGQISFQERRGEDCLAEHVAQILDKVRAKYREYDIDREPFVIVKADAGTYGMGIMTVKSPDDVRDLNRKQRNKMSVVKEGLEVSEVMVQEGVYTFETVKEAVAEPVIYMIDQFVVGGFYRVHTGRGQDENLNAPGMHFEPMPFDGTCLLPELESFTDCAPNRFYAYGVIARLALVAAALELEEMAADHEEHAERQRKLA
ncbi:MAG: glutamate--cysteine ligase, partial [Burkholderiales bacterium]|nr:glutamate--cysteine ligase [Burkholderiales bacterium]